MVKYVYTLGLSGERTKVVELDRTVEYTYDSLYRLTSEIITADGKTTEYTYAYDNVSKTTETNGKSPVKVYYLNDNSGLTNVLVELNADGT